VVGVLLLAGGLLVLHWYVGIQTIALDRQTLCPIEGGPRGYLAVLLDFSDPPNEIQREALLKELQDLESEIPAYHRVQVIAIRPSAATGLPEPSFDRCKPPWGEKGSGFSENPDLLLITA
jgi:hypothetical protein